ncbi:MAG: chalcone isomerase family protein [Pseudomonadota bacterium]
MILVRCVCLVSIFFGLAHAAEDPIETGDWGPGSSLEQRITDTQTTFKKIGEASFKLAWLRVYDAELYVSGEEFAWEEPFKLTLTYNRDITQYRFVKSSIGEISRTSGFKEDDLAYLKEPLEACFPPVEKGDTITGYAVNRDRVDFYFNGTQSCALEEENIRELFFGIWLSENTRSQKNSEKLRGLRT